jgi:hypothetical protein
MWKVANLSAQALTGGPKQFDLSRSEGRDVIRARMEWVGGRQSYKASV